MGEAYSAHRGEERCIQDSGGETLRKETTWETQALMGDNVQMDLQEVGCGVCTGSIWLNIRTGSRHL